MTANTQNINLIRISQELLLNAKRHKSEEALVQALENTSEKILAEQLKSDDDKKAFWINIYNAFTQIILSKNPAEFKNRILFFSAKRISIAGKQLSLDDIE